MTTQLPPKRGAGTPFDEAVRARSANGGAPQTFAELLTAKGKGVPTCSCGAPASIRLQLVVRPITGERKAPKTITQHRSEFCEPCAVHLFADFRDRGKR